MRCVACAVSRATWLQLTAVHAQCVVLRVPRPGSLGSRSPMCILGALRRPEPLGSCSPMCTLGALCCVCGFVGHLAPVHWCARFLCCVVCAMFRVTWLLFTATHAPCALLRLRCPEPPGCCSPLCSLGLLCCVRGVLGHLAPVHRCGRSVCCAVCFVGGVLGHFAPVHQCACCVCCVACAGRRCGAHTPRSGRRLSVAGRGCVPSGRAHVYPDGGCFLAGRGCVPSRRVHVHPDGGYF